ncbi:MAG: colanic acid biosynthesis glycosyltransferase WcaL [Calditrichaeota bacterium]|nr:MAG: colanic acid biosynthesis glycosyltransferase WcaL [Calditrichota bacterium]
MNRPPRDDTIGIILKGYPRLSETFITNEIMLLEQLGLRLHIFALRNPGESKIHENVKKVRAKVTYIPDYFWRSFFAIIGSNLRLWLRQPGTYWTAFRFALLRSLRQKSSSTIKRFSQAAYLVERCLDSTPVAHFHAHFSHGPTTVAFFASWLTGIRYSFSAHAKDIYLQEPVFFRQKIHGAEFVVTCTEFNRAHIEKISSATTPIYRAYHGVDIRYFKPSFAHGFKNELPVILSVGRFVPKKGFPVLIKALKILRQKGFSYQAYFIGGGPEKEKLEALIARLDLNDNIQLLSKMCQKEVLEYYRQADLFALACEVQEDGDRDGIPNVLVEAMAMGLPVVSTNISGIPELIAHEENGLLVPEKDPEAMAGALIRLLTDAELANRLARAGRAWVERDFDNHKNIAKIGELLSRVLARKPLAQELSAGPRSAVAPENHAKAEQRTFTFSTEPVE